MDDRPRGSAAGQNSAYRSSCWLLIRVGPERALRHAAVADRSGGLQVAQRKRPRSIGEHAGNVVYRRAASVGLDGGHAAERAAAHRGHFRHCHRKRAESWDARVECHVATLDHRHADRKADTSTIRYRTPGQSAELSGHPARRSGVWWGRRVARRAAGARDHSRADRFWCAASACPERTQLRAGTLWLPREPKLTRLPFRRARTPAPAPESRRFGLPKVTFGPKLTDGGLPPRESRRFRLRRETFGRRGRQAGSVPWVVSVLA